MAERELDMGGADDYSDMTGDEPEDGDAPAAAPVRRR